MLTLNTTCATVKVSGKENIDKKQSYIITPNHQFREVRTIVLVYKDGRVIASEKLFCRYLADNMLALIRQPDKYNWESWGK